MFSYREKICFICFGPKLSQLAVSWNYALCLFVLNLLRVDLFIKITLLIIKTDSGTKLFGKTSVSCFKVIQ